MLIGILVLLSFSVASAAAAKADGDVAESGRKMGVIQLVEKAQPTALAIDTETNMLYVAHRDTNRISVTDAKTNSVSQTIDSGGTAPFALAINPENNKLYVANFGSNSIAVIDTKTRQILANVTSINYHPYRIAINPDTGLVYVASIGSVSSLNVIDGATDRVVYNVTLARGMSNGLAINPNTNIAFVTHDFSNLVSVTDISPPSQRNGNGEDRLIETLQVGARVFDVAVNSKTNLFYVAAHGDRSPNISVIDGSTHRALENVTINGYFSGMTVNSELNRVYVANGWSNSTTVIDGFSNAVMDVIPVPNGADAMAVNPTDSAVYIANRSNSITVIDGLTEEWQTHYAVNGFVNVGPPDPYQIFKIHYRVINGIAEQFSMPYVEYVHYMQAKVDSDGNGTLEIRFPKNYPNANVDGGGGAF